MGRVTLDPDETRLGVDAFELTASQLAAIVGASRAPVKAVLMDQRRVAGLGNLLIDEVLWRAGIRPDRPAGELDADDRRALFRAVRTTLRMLGRRGGSHTGDLERNEGVRCSKDGGPIRRAQVGGRSTYWCEAHQR